ncbi:MAG: NAD(P)-binding protein, partial [Bacteroidetes bacterium]|nr:NAD(P)-binding protein [Bacteroidota bacterium]
MSTPPKTYEGIIIGAGLAGLTAGHKLRHLQIAILEKENRVGGRVFVEKYENFIYELGAVLPYSGQLLPFHLHSPQKEILPRE